MSDLPDGWARANLLSIAEMVRGVTYTKDVVRGAPSNTTISVLRANNIQERGFALSDLVYVPAELVSEKQFVRKGDVVVATSSGSISVVGKAAQARQDMHVGFGAFCGLLRPNCDLDSRYFGYYFSTEAYRSAVASMARGVNINNLKRSHFESLKLPIPPRNEQTRIADQLDKLLARIQSCNDRLDAIPALLKRFRQAVLAAATSAALIESDNPGATWSDATIGSIAVDLRYGTSKKCDYSSAGTGVLRIPNIADQGRIDIGDLKRAEFDSKEISKLALRGGDLLVIRSNGSVDLVGKTSLVTVAESGLLFAGYLMRLRVDPAQALPAFIQLCLSAPAQRQYIERTAKSTSGVNNLNAEELRALRLRLPSLTEQAEIVRRVEALFKLADRIDARYKAARTHAQRITPLLLAKAFRGELVPQDPNDEPASVLLERIAAERAKTIAQPRSRKSTAGRKAETNKVIQP